MEFIKTEEFKSIMWTLSAVYGILAVIPLVQILRVHFRAPHIGWSILKLFLLFTMVASLIRCISFAIYSYLSFSNFFLSENDSPVFLVLFNVPRIIYFTGFSLLILFWAEILHKVNHELLYRLNNTKTIFIMLNVFVYLIQIIIWVPIFFYQSWSLEPLVPKIESIFFTVVSLFVAALFLIFGGRLFFKLKSFPIESEGRNSVLWEVGTVAAICFAGFTIRAAVLILTTVMGQLDMEPLVILFYYISVEVIPMIAVMLILSRPTKDSFKKGANDYSNSDENSSNPDDIVALPEEEDYSGSSNNTIPNSKQYYASNPRSYHWARVLDSGSLPPAYTVNFPSADGTTTENSQLLWHVDENYVDKK
jgi:hypothetical protein